MSKRKPKEKLTKLRGARFGESTARRLSDIAESLQWSESQVIRWCVQRSLPTAESLRIKGPLSL